MSVKRLASCAQDFQVTGGRGGTERGREGRRGGGKGWHWSCDHWNHLCHDTLCSHCIYYTIKTQFTYPYYTPGTTPVQYIIIPFHQQVCTLFILILSVHLKFIQEKVHWSREKSYHCVSLCVTVCHCVSFCVIV